MEWWHIHHNARQRHNPWLWSVWSKHHNLSLSHWLLTVSVAAFTVCITASLSLFVACHSLISNHPLIVCLRVLIIMHVQVRANARSGVQVRSDPGSCPPVFERCHIHSTIAGLSLISKVELCSGVYLYENASAKFTDCLVENNQKDWDARDSSTIIWLWKLEWLGSALGNE